VSKKAEKLLASLPEIKSYKWDKELGELVEGKVKVRAWVGEDDEILVSAENGDGAADYYGEFSGGDPKVHEDLEKWAEKKGGIWEWVNPGVVAFWLN